MLHILKTHDYLRILNDNEVKDFVVTNFGEYFKSTKKNCVLNFVEQELKKVDELLYIFLTTPDDDVEKYVQMMQSNSSDNFVHCYNIEILKLFDPELQLINTKHMIKNKLKELLSYLKKIKAQTELALEYMKRNSCKNFHCSAKPVASDSDIDEALHPCIMAKVKNSASKYWDVIETIVKHSIKTFELV